MVKHYNHQVSLHIEKSSFFLSQSKSPFQNTPPTRLSLTNLFRFFPKLFEICSKTLDSYFLRKFEFFFSLKSGILLSLIFIDEKAYLKLLFSNKFSFYFMVFRPLLWYEGELITSFHKILIFISYECSLRLQVVKFTKLS